MGVQERRPLSLTLLPPMAARDPERLAVTAALVFRDGRLLITQRRPGDHLGGLWEFPGGKIEPGETPEACLRRELEEELGIEVTVGDRVAEIAHDYPDRRVHLQFFRCAITRGEPAPLHCVAVAWVTRDELDRYPFPAADAALLERLRAAEAGWGEGLPG